MWCLVHYESCGASSPSAEAVRKLSFTPTRPVSSDETAEERSRQLSSLITAVALRRPLGVAGRGASLGVAGRVGLLGGAGRGATLAAGLFASAYLWGGEGAVVSTCMLVAAGLVASAHHETLSAV